MMNVEKYEFLKHAKELAKKLESSTEKKLSVWIGWIETDTIVGNLDVCLAVNHPTSWFVFDENQGWNESIIWNNIHKFVPAPNGYLQLNKLIEKVYEE